MRKLVQSGREGRDVLGEGLSMCTFSDNNRGDFQQARILVASIARLIIV